ncbi:TPA: DivIVA domain-containing protein [Streptococcus suis]|nr:DivIVA domain-containing protein [Streptococcus suis]
MRFKKYLFWGYTQKSVDEVFKWMKEKIHILEELVIERDLEIDRLRNQLKRAKAEEVLIKEAIIDARALSKKLIEEARNEADSLMSTVETDMADNFNRIEQKISHIKGLREHYFVSEKKMQEELRATLNRYLDAIDKNSVEWSEQNTLLESELQRTEEAVGNFQNIIQFSRQKRLDLFDKEVSGLENIYEKNLHSN